jgi:GNAT superfamily N-acetyltransferase
MTAGNGDPCSTQSATFDVSFLADHLHVLEKLADLLCAEWPEWYGDCGKGNAQTDLVEASGKEELPVALVALGSAGELCGGLIIRAETFGVSPEIGPWLSAGVVRPEFRRQGIGSALVNRAAEHARYLGYSSIYAATSVAASILPKPDWAEAEFPLPTFKGPVTVYQRVF